jgi:ribonuclease BN (tRNA processing enzyme)
VRVQFLGAGTPLGQDGRLQACILVSTEHARVLLDCGMTALVGLARAAVPPQSIDAVVISHLHGDHFGGLPLLLLERAVREQAVPAHPPRPLTVAGPPGTAARLRHAMEVLGWPGAWEHAHRTAGLEFLTLRARNAERVAGLDVTAFPVPHYPWTAPLALRLTFGSVTLAYSGDAAWADALVEAADGADLFVCGVWSYDTPDPTFLDYRTLQAHRHALRCKRLILTHLGPSVLEHLDAVRADGMEVADDGLTIEQ